MKGYETLKIIPKPVKSVHCQVSIIIDDDAFGPMHYMLLNAPDVEVLGITTVSGNTWANRVTAQSLRGLEISGDTDVPVVEGATFPGQAPEFPGFRPSSAAFRSRSSGPLARFTRSSACWAGPRPG